jgi:hypothetical protein
VEVVIETHYYFLNDVMTPHIDKYRRIHSPYRHGLVKKFRQTMQRLTSHTTIDQGTNYMNTICIYSKLSDILRCIVLSIVGAIFLH